MAPSDESLLMQVAGRDQNAFMGFYDRFAPRVFGLVSRLLGDAADAEDVLQDVMWEVWQKAGGFDPVLGSAGSWVLMMARARSIDRIRSRGRERARLESLRGSVPPEWFAPATPRGDAEPVGEALRRLPAQNREVIELAFFGGLTRQQIAESVGIPAGTVKTRIRAGVRQLREMLQETVAH